MMSKSALNGLQRMMLRWEEFHAVNAAHVVQLGERHPPAEVERAAAAICRSLGLRPIAFNRRRTAVHFHDPREDSLEASPPFRHLSVPGSIETTIGELLHDPINQLFGDEPHWPVRLYLIQAPAGQFFTIVYQHALSDSRGISLMVREIVRALSGRPALVDRLDFHPPALKALFPAELGWRGLIRRTLAAASELLHSQQCFYVPRRAGTDFSVESAIRSTQFPTAVLKQSARRLGVTVHVLTSAAMLEGLRLNFDDALERSKRRKTLAIYSPADLRRESPVDIDQVVGQMLGCITSRLEIPEGTPFPLLVAQIDAQTNRVKRRGEYREHSAHMDVMSRIWDCLPRSLNRVAGPTLIPLTGFLSNVNLSEFLAEEISAGLVRDYFRFSGTGILSPMMLGLTTVGEMLNFTTTHHANVFTDDEVARIAAHVRWRLAGHVEEIATPDHFREREFQPEVLPLEALPAAAAAIRKSPVPPPRRAAG